jgi:predicted permease
VITDLRFAIRTFAKRPGFALVAILTLALGIGAATAVFSIVNAVLLKPLPYRDPNRLVAIWITSTREKNLAKLFALYSDYQEFRAKSQTLQDVSVATWAVNTGRVLTGHGPARGILTIPASANFFETLGVQAAIGRTFSADDKGCNIVLSNKFWSANPVAVGKTLILDQKPCTILGVMPENFSFYPTQTQAWALLGPDFQPDQNKMLVGIFARLKPNVTASQAQAELRSLFRPLHSGGETRYFEPVVFDLHGEFTFLAGRTLRTTLVLLFAAVLLVLLIACLNVANLLLAQLSDRRREFAVRAALGSGQGRLIRQVLTEGFLLASAGAVLGLAIAYIAIRYFRVANPIELNVGADVRINPIVLSFSVLLAMATTIFFSLLPALRASKVDLTRHLKSSGRGATRTRFSFAKAVIAIEVALSFVLLIGASLLMTSALRMGSENLGFNPDHLFAGNINLPPSRYSTDTERRQFYDRLQERLSGIALASKIPPEAGGNQTIEIQGRPVDQATALHDIGADAVSPSFFDILSIPLHRGRSFHSQDRETSQPVAIVNEALTREYFPHADPIGQQIRIPGGQMPWLTIVGVVGNLKHTQLMDEMTWVETPILYRPLAQEPRPRFQIAARASAESQKEIQRQIADIDPLVPIAALESINSRLAHSMAYPRFRAMVLAFFAFSALLLSAVGLHGVLSQLVAQRTPEFGVRRAVGAQTYHLLLLIARQGGIPVLIGLGAGLAATLAFSRAIAVLLYRIQPADPAMLAIVTLSMLAIAILAIALPATRAARVDPMVALRDD